MPNTAAQSRLRTKLTWVLGIVASLCLAACGGEGEAGNLPSVTGSDYADFANPVVVAIIGYTGDAMEPFISKDGQYLFFNNRNDPNINTDLFYASRVDDHTFTFLGPLPNANSPQLDAVASLDTLGNFVFVSTRSYATTLSTLYEGRFSNAGLADVALISGVSLQKPGWVNFDAEISGDGQTLWFDDGQYSSAGILESASISIAVLQTNGSFQRLANGAALLATVNSGGLNYAPDISQDGLELFFTRIPSMSSAAAPAIYRATRPDVGSAFTAPSLVSGASGFVEAPFLSGDGHFLYFHKMVNGTFIISRLQR